MNGDDLIAQEYNKWTSFGTNVTGASSEWQEDLDSDELHDEFFGRSTVSYTNKTMPTN